MTPAPPPTVAVLIGRFQPFHNAHLALLRRALAAAEQVIVVIGSAHQARTPRNPFTWTERAQMIREALVEADRARVRTLPMRDVYDEERWAGLVRDGVAAMTAQENGSTPSITLVGHFKDDTSNYLRAFPDWPLLHVDRLPGADGTQLRDALFGAAPGHIDATLAALEDSIPAATGAFLRNWLATPIAADLADEWRMLRQDKAAWSTAPYPPVFVTVDAIVRCAGHVLLIQRARAPGRGLHAVPGGFIEQRETVYQSAVRELAEETHLRVDADTLRHCLRATAVFDHPDRSQRGRTITHAHYFDLGERALPAVRADDDAQAVEWVPIERLTAMEDRFHDDHFHMLDHFLGLIPA